ncbi:MAG: DUF1460 domain-containing protein [Cyanobacteria bacterium REEB67]|nr:DUF1460 domain-containing protein [Cyanobacteria bacterium REEB67]
MLASVAGGNFRPALASISQKYAFTGSKKFAAIIAHARSDKWSALPIGELMGKIALELEGTPYVASTLELSSDREICSVNLDGLDCVTFFESTLDLARIIKKGKDSEEDLLKEINHTRYRGGVLGDYPSRLHYTTDWFVDNEKKGVVKILDNLPGAEPFTQQVSIMSANPQSSRQLTAHPELVAKIKAQEDQINSRHLDFIPLDKIAAVEPLLKTGDIVGVCTNQTGIDITHTGLIYKDESGTVHFMDASSKKSVMKVTIERGPISQSLNWSKHLTGAMFARPLEP